MGGKITNDTFNGLTILVTQRLMFCGISTLKKKKKSATFGTTGVCVVHKKQAWAAFCA